MVIVKTPKTRSELRPRELSLPDLREEVEQIKHEVHSFTIEEKQKARAFLLEAKEVLNRQINAATSESLEGLEELGQVMGEINRLLPGLLDDIP